MKHQEPAATEATQEPLDGALDVTKQLAQASENERPGPPKIELQESGVINIFGQEDAMAAALGGLDTDIGNRLLGQVISTITTHEPEDADYNYVLAALHAIGPRDPLEGMMAVQAVGCHNLAMRFMGLAAHPEQSSKMMSTCADRAAKMSRTFTALLEALGKLRGNAGQKVEVRHVHVGDGGQAVIGNVQGGGGK